MNTKYMIERLEGIIKYCSEKCDLYYKGQEVLAKELLEILKDDTYDNKTKIYRIK